MCHRQVAVVQILSDFDNIPRTYKSDILPKANQTIFRLRDGFDPKLLSKIQVGIFALNNFEAQNE